MKKTIEIEGSDRHFAGSVEVSRLDVHFRLYVTCGGVTSNNMTKSMSHEKAKELRDALIELYPLEPTPSPRRYTVGHYDGQPCVYETVVEARRTSVKVAEFTNVPLAQRFADMMNAEGR